MAPSRRIRMAVSSFATVSLAVAALATPVSAAVHTAASFKVVEAGVRAPSSAHPLGTVNGAAHLTFSVYLNSRDASGLAAYAAAVTNTHSVSYGHYLTRGAFATRFGASPSSIANTVATLRSEGLTVSPTIVNGIALHVSGTAATISHAFQTHLESYRLASGTLGMAATSSIKVPAAIGANILAVVGLNNLVQPTSNAKHIATTIAQSQIRRPSTKNAVFARHFATRPHLVAGAPSACAGATGATQLGYGGITDDQVASAYGFGNLYSHGDLGAGQTIAVYELEPFATSDIATFENCYFGADNTKNITTINIDGGPGVGAGSGESSLDIENIAALAPAAKIAVYQGSSTTAGVLDTYAQIVADDTAKVVTSSWGECESLAQTYSPGSLATENLIFEQAAAQGQSVFSSAGDDGADDCAGHASQPSKPLLSVEDPASQPYVISVGGTTALSVSNPPAEQVWNDGATGGATGGGSSLIWSMPSWQQNVASVASSSTSSVCGASGTTACRVEPDVSAFADEYTGITVYTNGTWGTIGGTSSSAPIWAAALAEINSSQACATNPATVSGVGFVSPLLYEVGGNPTLAAQGFHDVTSGNNDIFSTNGGKYAATTGFDLTTGFGTPNLAANDGSGLASSLCQAAQESTTSSLTSVSPTSGTATGNTKVTIHGLGFKTGATINVKGVSFGDFPATSFTVKSATTIVAYTSAEGQPKFLGSSLPAAATSLVEVTFNSGHVAVGPSFNYLPATTPSGVPTIIDVGPNAGVTAGGNTVEIHGVGFSAGNTVTFGGVPATSVNVVSSQLITAVAPAQKKSMCLAASHTAVSGLCQTQVQVTNKAGTSVVLPAQPPLQGFLQYNNSGAPYAPANCHCEVFPTLTEYDYQATPTITKVTNESVAKGMSANPYGSDLVVITGTGFNWMTTNWVDMGDPTLTSSQDFSIQSIKYNEIQFASRPDLHPSPTGDTVPVSVASMVNQSNSVDFTYGPSPVITGLSDLVLPSAGDPAGTKNFVITGAGFSHVQGVVFQALGTGASTYVQSKNNFSVAGSTQISVESPSLTPGSYEVIVVTAYGQTNGNELSSTPFPAAPFTVQVINPGQAAITSVSGTTTCTTAGGCTIDIFGVNFGTPSDIVPVFGGILAGTVINFSQTGGVDDLTVTVPETLPTLTGAYDIQLYTDNGVTAVTPTAVENYVYGP